jgi:hypothetical protein
MGLSQDDFGKIFGFEWYKIKDIETGKTRIKEEIENWLAKEKGVNLHWLLTGKGEKLLTELQASAPAEIIALQSEIIKGLKENARLREKVDGLTAPPAGAVRKAG